jgi:hypothetical protein
VLDLSVRAFSRAYKDVDAPIGTSIVFEVDAEGDNVWSVTREQSEWVVTRGRHSAAAATVRADGDTAWKLLYNALSPEAARARVAISGDMTMVEPMLGARSVMV